VVYAGAAPGTHTRFLSEMFPNVTFHLVDPAPFSITETDKIFFYRDLFTDDLARYFKENFSPTLFISDIRTADPSLHHPSEIEKRVESDMKMQMDWHDIMRPLQSMLKFRLPWFEGTTEYLAGDIYLPVWGRTSTTECRLITKKNSIQRTIYDNKTYEEQMFYFNQEIRPNVFPHQYHGCGIDHCYDCTAEGYILTRYLITRHNITFEEALTKFAALSEKISRLIDHFGRTLRDGNLDREQQNRSIRRNQWKNGKPAYER
jgi:hypothetical protein